MSPRRPRSSGEAQDTPPGEATRAEVSDIVRRGVIEVIPEDEFVGAIESGRKLRLKLGLDPSKPDLHIGHGVLLRKLRGLQGMGHRVVLIVGDWTAQIGDPSGQSATRPMLTAEEVKANAETYMRQFFHVVDRERTEVRWQSEWFGKFTLEDVVRLAGRFTVAQMLQREDFRRRFEAQKPLGVHELLYPLLQAYDSVAIEADVEFGGSDQRFNLLVGRELQQAMGQRPQMVFIMGLLVGTDGVQKMSKSLGNTVDFEDPPNEKYGKLMSVPDGVLPDYLELATDMSDEELGFMRRRLQERSINPMEVKKRLAREVVAQFHGEAAAREAEGEFERVFANRETPEETAIPVPAGELPSPKGRGPAKSTAEHRRRDGKPVSMPALLSRFLGLSMSEARRLLKEGAVEIDRKPVTAPVADLKVGSIIRVGKHRFLRIVDAEEETTT
jgi:tyrosyl-tRNA synthetase